MFARHNLDENIYFLYFFTYLRTEIFFFSPFSDKQFLE